MRDQNAFPKPTHIKSALNHILSRPCQHLSAQAIYVFHRWPIHDATAYCMQAVSCHQFISVSMFTAGEPITGAILLAVNAGVGKF